MGNLVKNDWELLKSKYEQANQMAVQTVEAFKEIGEMLIDLKKTTKHGEFGLKCAEVFGKNQIRTGSSEMDDANRQAQKYMRLAEHWDTIKIENPQSLNEAMKMIPSQRKTKGEAAIPKKFKSWSAMALDYGLLKSANGYAKETLKNKLLKASGLESIPSPANMSNEVQVSLVKGFEILRHQQDIEKNCKSFNSEDVESLSETAKQKFDRIVERQLAKLQVEYNMAVSAYEKQFNERVYEEYKRVNAEWLARSRETALEHAQAITQMQVLRQGIKPHITVDDYKFLLNCLHPDRAPEDRREKFARAFDVVRKIEPYIEQLKKSKKD